MVCYLWCRPSASTFPSLVPNTPFNAPFSLFPLNSSPRDESYSCNPAHLVVDGDANMSLVGNFTSNGDREASRNAPPPSIMARRPSQAADERIGSDTSDASTIAANTDEARSRGNTNERSDAKGSAFTTNANSEAVSVEENNSIERRTSVVHELARKYTQQSTTSTTRQNPFSVPAGSALDPNGEHFNARAWAKAMLHTQQEDPQAAPIRTAGVAFRNLNVHGFGTDTDYQKSVGNVWLEGPGFIRKVMGNKGRKIDILQSVDGLVEAGEMLVVLGPPGSGCSTFLKTITGETHGFFVDEHSDVNYQGMPRNRNPSFKYSNSLQVLAHAKWQKISGERLSTLPKLMSTFP